MNGRLALLVGVGALGAGELVTRKLSPGLPALRVWHDPVAQLKVAQMVDRRRQGAIGGVVFAGSSQVLEGVSPSVVAPALGARAYNAALHRGFLPLTERWLLDEVLPRLRPRLVVLGLGLLDLTDHGVAQYEVVDRFEAALARRSNVPSRLVRAALEKSALARHASAPLGPHVVLRDLRIGPDGEGREFATATEYRLSEKKRAYIEGELLADYDTGPRSVGALRRIVAGVRSAGADLVLVALPHTEEVLTMLPGGSTKEALARATLASAASEQGVRLIDAIGDVRDRRWFADCIHLNGAGMRHASELLRAALALELADLQEVGR